MKLWLISQDANGDYDTFDSAIVAAPDETAARETHPKDSWHSDGAKTVWRDGKWVGVRADGSIYDTRDDTWTKPDNVTVKLIGTALDGADAGVVCASFNAG